MSDTQISLHCPKCGESLIQRTDNLDLEKPITCAACGTTSHVREFKTASGQSLIDYVADLARDALKGIKGFKPKR